MDWSAADFVFAGVLLGCIGAAGAAGALALRASLSLAYRAGALLAVAGAVMLVWANGAVGIIGGANNDANLMFFAVLAIGAAGVLLARFRARGMARALTAMAVAQGLAGAIALAGGFGVAGASWPLDVIAATGVFTLLWLASAWLFRMSGHAPAGAVRAA